MLSVHSDAAKWDWIVKWYCFKGIVSVNLGFILLFFYCISLYFELAFKLSVSFELKKKKKTFSNFICFCHFY